MSNISKMFPVIFYLVAVLISLTSMTRMIEEERIEIGTLKAMGYTNMQIISKYIIYSLFACIIGGVLGMTVGLYLLPNIVWMLYSMIYNLPEFYLDAVVAVEDRRFYNHGAIDPIALARAIKTWDKEYRSQIWDEYRTWGAKDRW